MALLFRHNGSSLVIGSLIILWFVLCVRANSDAALKTGHRDAAETLESSKKHSRWWHFIHYSAFDQSAYAWVDQFEVFTASTLVLLAPLLLPCIWFAHRCIRMTNNADNSLDTIGTGTLIFQTLVNQY
jgi:hypothetical protein